MENKKIGAGVGVMLLKDGNVLLGKRPENPEKAKSELNGQGTWTIPGGKLHFQEDFEDAARREVEEETGIRLNKTKVVCVNNNKVKNAHFITISLLSNDFIGEPEVKEPDEITEWKWSLLMIYPPNYTSLVGKYLKTIKPSLSI